MGKTLREIFRIVAEGTRQPAEDPVARALREGVIVGLANHTLLIARDGTERPVADSAAPIKDEAGTITGVVLVFRDTTELRRWEEVLRKSEEHHRIMIEQVREYAIFTLDPAGNSTSWNAGVERILGYSEGEFLGLPFASIFTTEDAAGGRSRARARRAAERGSSADDRWQVRKDGTTFWANGFTTALTGLDGQLIGFTKVLRDLTDQKFAEEERAALLGARAGGPRRGRGRESGQGSFPGRAQPRAADTADARPPDRLGDAGRSGDPDGTRAPPGDGTPQRGAGIAPDRRPPGHQPDRPWQAADRSGAGRRARADRPRR